MRPATGFTLVELMVTLVIVAIVATVAVPAWSGFIRTNQLAAATNEFVTAVNYARSEAVRRNAPVSLCPSSDQSNCVDTTDWSDGWIVFLGDDADDTDTVLRAWGEFAGAGTLETTTNQLVYGPDGSAGSSVDFGLEFPGCEGNGRRTISIGFVGRPTSQEAACA